MSRDCIIYKIINTKTNQIYIGSSVNIKQRINRHFKDLKANKHHSLKMQRSYNKYGKDVFEVTYMCTFPEEYRQKMEQWFLDNNECYFNNELVVGKPSLNRVFSEECRKKYSDRMMGNEFWKLMQPISEETRLKLSNAHKGRICSNETKNKISLSKLGNKGRKGQPHLEETKEKMSINSKNKRAVLQYTVDKKFIKEWESLIEASKGCGISCENIRKCCQNLVKRPKKFFFSYKDSV